MHNTFIQILTITNLSLLLFIAGCDHSNALDDQVGYKYASTNDSTIVKSWHWGTVQIPAYQWPQGTAFGNGLFVDVAFDPDGVSIYNGLMRFKIDPLEPKPPSNAPSPHNYRSEIHTAPWNIQHPLGTEQWLGWRYIFGRDYEYDTSNPITIFQNHPGVRGLSPQFELELAARDNPRPAMGGELQIVNAAGNDRIVLPVRPIPGDTLDVVVHVIYGKGSNGLLQIWLDNELYYNQNTATVYDDTPWGGNNKWGIYHHAFNDSPKDVEASLNRGAGKFNLYMGTLRMVTRTPNHSEYNTDAFELVRPDQ